MSTGRRRLATAVILPDADGVFTHFGFGEVPPSWAAEALKDSDVWGETPADPEPEEPEEPEEPVSSPESDSQAPTPTEGEDGPEKPEEDADGGDEDLIGDAPTVEQPAGNGSLEDWTAYARSKGATAEDLDGKSRNEIRAAYGD